MSADMPTFNMPLGVLGDDSLVAVLRAGCSVQPATEQLPFTEGDIDRHFNPLALFPRGTQMIDGVMGPELLDPSAWSSTASARVLPRAPDVNSPSLQLLVPSHLPGLAAPGEDMLPPQVGEEDDEDDDDDDDDVHAGEAVRAATVLQDSLASLASALGMDSVW